MCENSKPRLFEESNSVIMKHLDEMRSEECISAPKPSQKKLPDLVNHYRDQLHGCQDKVGDLQREVAWLRDKVDRLVALLAMQTKR